MSIERNKKLCLYAFRHGVSLRVQTPGNPQNTKVLFDCGLLYLPAIVTGEPTFLEEVTALELPDDVAMQLGSRFSQFDAKAYLTTRVETKRLAEKEKVKNKPFGTSL